MRLSAHGEPARIGKARFVVCLFSGTYKRFFCNFFSRAYIAYLIAGALFFISAQLFAQQPVVMEWPLTGMHQVAKPNPFSSLGFNTGKSVDSLQFTEEFGATTTGWNTDNPDPEAYYEYTITPAPGRSIEITRLNFEVSLSRVNMRTSVQYSYDGFRQQKVQIGHTIYVGTPMPRNLPLKTSLRVTYPQTLTIRVYGWSTVDHKVSFHNRNVVFEGMLFGKELIAQTLEEAPAEPEVQELPLPVKEELLVVSPEPDPLAAMAVIPPGDTVINGGNNVVKAPMGSQTYTTSGTWVCPPGVTSITVECWGGGGRGGARTTGNNVALAGGGGGAYSRSVISVTPGASYTVNVGAGSSSTSAGGDSWFGSSATVMAKGGQSVADNSNTPGNGGLASASVGTFRYNGGNGATGTGGSFGGGGGSSAGTNLPGQFTNSTTNQRNGATAPVGGGSGGNGAASGASGIAGTAPGGGGGGGYRAGNNTTQNPGTGADGQVMINWTIPAGNCEGYAISVLSQSGVGNPNAALGAPDNAGAELHETNDRLELELTNGNLLTSGGSVVVRWRRTSDNNSTIRVEISTNGTTWTLVNDYSNINPQNTWINQNIPLSINTRYIRFTSMNGWDFQIDAVSFNTPCAPPCTQSTPPTSINASASEICSGTNVTLTSVGGSLGDDSNDVWYEGGCADEAFTQEWDIMPYLYNSTTVNSNSNGIMNVTSTGGDAMIYMENIGSYNTATYRYIQIRYRVVSGTAGNVEIYFSKNGGGDLSEAQVVRTGLNSDGNWNIVNVDMSASPNWTGTITGWRYDWCTNNGVTMELDFITLADRPIIGEGSSITVTPTTTTTYYTRKKGLCNSTSCVSRTVTVSPGSPAAPTATAGTNAGCTQFTANWNASANATGYYLDVSTVNTFATFIPGYNNLNVNNVTTYNVTGLTAGTTYYYRIRAYNICGPSTSYSNTITFSTSPPAPTAPVANAGTNAQCTQITANWAASANATGYYLDVSTVNTFATFVAGYNNLNVNNVTTYNVTGLAAGTTYYYRVRAYNGCGASANSGIITYATLPGTPDVPGDITGLALQCPNLPGQVYSITAVPNATTYAWTVPAGWNITAGAGTTSITVTTGAANQNGNITVTAGNTCGTSSASILAVTVQSLPAQPGPIQPATTEVCQNSIHNFVVMPPAPAGVTYTWAFPGATVLSGQGTNVVQIRFGNQSGTLTVTPSNSCGNGTPQTMAISVSTSSPTMPGVIAGVIAPCIGSTKTYTIADLGFLYSWTVPAGWTILSGQGSNSITVTVGATAGNISVTAGNACGGSSPRNLAVTPQAAAPAQPSEINGTSPVCAGSTQTYSVTAVPFVVYDWSVPAGWAILTGQGSNTITCTAGATSGTITVTPSNDCGTGTSRNRTIVVDVAPPAATSAITGNNNPCQNSTVSYSVAEESGITYTWSFPADWIINSGQGSHEVEVTVGAISGNISVVPSNGCGNGPATQLAVNVFLLPLSAGDITGDREFCEGTQHVYSVVNVSGVTYAWSFPAGWAINSGQGTPSVNVTAGVNSGNIQVIPQNACGNGPASTLEVTVNPLPDAKTGDNGAICVGASIQIGDIAVPGNTYLWRADPAGEVFDYLISNPVVKPAYTTTYTLTETNTATGCSNTNSVTILANQVISLSVNPAGQTICSGNNTSIVITSNISGTIFEWEPTLTVGDPVTTTGYTNGTGPLINQSIRNVSGATSTVSYLIKATAEECENSDLHTIVHINPEPVVNGQSATLCSDAASGLILGSSTNGVAITSYEIISINSNGLTASAGAPAAGTGFNANVIADDAWTNTGNNPVNVIYTVRPFSNAGCAGSNFTVTLTINPEPLITNANAFEICSGSATGINLTSSIPSTFQWTIGTITGGITGASAGSGSVINQVLTNPSNSLPGSVEYIVTPRSTSGTCFGNPVIITVTVNPGPVVTNEPTLRICSGSSTGITLSASTTATFTWTIGTITGGITGASAGSGGSINQTLTNPSNATSGTVEYRVVATSSDGGCVSPVFTITVTVDPIPAVTASASPTEICPGEEFDLFSISSLTWAPTTLVNSNFNNNPTGWTVTGSGNNYGQWTLRDSPYVYDGQTFSSNDNSRFFLATSRSLGSVNTYLSLNNFLNTNGYTSLNIEFYHYFRSGGTSSGRLQVSTDNSTWIDVYVVSSTTGFPGNFSNISVDLSSFVNQPNLYIRFNYNGNGNRYWAIDNIKISGASVNDIPVIQWVSSPAGFYSTEANPLNLTQSVTSTYIVSYTNPNSGCSAKDSVTVINKPLPGAQVIPDYCSTPGCIELTATGGGTYLWNTVPPSTQQTICVDEAGIYSVTVTGVNGCVETAFLSAATELVVDGSFTNFNASDPVFFTEYQQNQGYWDDPPPYDWGTPKGLHPENRYAVNTNAWYNYPGSQNGYHPNFHGRDHTNNTVGARNFMMINGSTDMIGSPPHLRTIWQQTVSIQENTNYYFSAWGMNLNPDSPARLQFEIVTAQNGAEQVGSIADLNIAEKPTSEAQVGLSNWVRFYSTPFWTSPAGATTAIIRIINLNTDPGGNDFGLDDISFGTLDPIPFTFSPSVVGGNNIVCEGSDIELTANISGGLPPYTYNWSGPNGFTSTLANPVIPNATLLAAGTYTLVVSDSYGCDPQSGSVVVEILPAPDASISGGGDYCQFSGSPFIWFTATVGEPPFTFEYNINGGATQTVTTWGSDMSTFVIAPTSSTGTFVYTLTHVSDNNGCERDLNVSTTVVVHSLPSAYITGDLVVCPRSENIYSGNAGMSGYEWNITGNGSIPGQANQQLVTIEAGGNCDEAFTLLLTVADEHGCHATAEEVILVDDVDAPVISGSIPLTEVEGCSISDLPAAVATIEGFENLGVAVSDNCNEDMLLLSHSDAAPSGHCPIVVVRTYTITDACGNQTNAEQTIHIDDTTPPLVDCNVSGTQQVNVNSGNVYIHPDDTWDAHASDNCPGIVTLTAMLTGDTESGPFTTLRDVTFNQGTTTVTWTATDECGNIATCSFLVEVAGTADLEIQKTGPATITAGETISWTITITNLGPATAPSLRMEDNVPAQVTNPEYSIDGGTSWSLWTGSLSAGPLALGSDMEILIRGKVACDATDFTNTATVQLEVLTDPDTDNNTSSLATTIENELAVNAIIDNTLCPGNHDGRINITVSGGTAPYSFSWTGPNGFTSNQQNINNLEAGTYSLTVTDANGCTYTEDFVVESEPDTEPPTFTAPGPFEYCVINIISAQYDGQPEPAADIIPLLPEHGNPRRPDWYLVNSGSTELDLTNIADNCCDATDITISWTITFDPLVGGTLSGTGQPSLSTPIQLWGTAANVPVNHTITYTVTDCNGNVAATVSRNILIRSRPEVIKQ